MKKTPIIDVTDLYHPHQDCGGNLDLIAPYALPEIDLQAIIMDCTERFRLPKTDHPHPHYRDATGPRDPGFIPVTQLNAIFNRNVPAAVGPYALMTSPEDPMWSVPKFQQTGIDLILKTLRQSEERVHILIFGSSRSVTAAYNREPELFREKVARIHLCACGVPYGYLEWNVMLDPMAIVGLLRSDLPIAIYPCATDVGPFEYGQFNTFWKLPNLEFIREMDPALRRYLGFAFGRVVRMDFLRAIEEDLPADLMERVYAMPHNVWETVVWMQVSHRRLVRRSDGSCRIIPEAEVLPTDLILPGELRPITMKVDNDGQFHCSQVESSSNRWLYYRGDAKENEAALRDALPALYRSFQTGA